MHFVETEAAERLTAKPKASRSPQRRLKLSERLIGILFFSGMILFSPPVLIALAVLFYAAVPFLCYSVYTAAAAANGLVGLLPIPLLIATVVAGFGSFFFVMKALFNWDNELGAVCGITAWIALHVIWSGFVVFNFLKLFGFS